MKLPRSLSSLLTAVAHPPKAASETQAEGEVVRTARFNVPKSMFGLNDTIRMYSSLVTNRPDNKVAIEHTFIFGNIVSLIATVSKEVVDVEEVDSELCYVIAHFTRFGFEIKGDSL